MELRKEALESLRIDTIAEMPSLLWLSEQRDVWDVFNESNFLGNSRIAPCSAQLKQRMARRYVREHFSAEDTVLYLGIDWTEEHRTKAPRKNWSPYPVEFPLCDEPYVNKIDIMRDLDAIGIDPPQLYALGFSHNNCGGFCVRAGQGHFANLLEKNRELYLYHEGREREFIERIGKNVSILKRTKTEYEFIPPIAKSVEELEYPPMDSDDDREEYLERREEYIERSLYGYRKRTQVNLRLSLEQLRKELETSQQTEIDFDDIGGCGCFVDESKWEALS